MQVAFGAALAALASVVSCNHSVLRHEIKLGDVPYSKTFRKTLWSQGEKVQGSFGGLKGTCYRDLCIQVFDT